MPVFIYTAKDTAGNLVKAEVEADSVPSAAKLLTAQQLFPLSIDTRKVGLLSGGNLAEKLHRISTKDKVIFTRQLATLFKAGLPLAQSLRILQEQIENPKLLRMVRNVSNRVEGGETLSRSLASYPDTFSPIYLSMVESGEVSGNLDEVLLRLATQEEKTQQINSKIRGALTYPAVVLAVLIAVMTLMITVVLPQVGKMYIELQKPLPLMTKILLGFAGLLTKFWYVFILMLIGAVYGLRVYVKSPQGRRMIDRLKLKIPVFKILLKKMYMARFARTLGSLIASGVPVLQALSIVAKAMNNVFLETEVIEIANKVKAGVAMSKPISESPHFLPLVGQMIHVGEKTGTMGDSLNKVAAYYEDEVDEAIKNISTLIEPATMIVLGLMVAFLIAAVLLPIYGLVSGIR